MPAVERLEQPGGGQTKLQIGCAKAASEAPNFVAFQHISTLLFETFDKILGILFLGLELKCGSKTVLSPERKKCRRLFLEFLVDWR